MSSVSKEPSPASKNVIQIDEPQILSHFEEVDRSSLEDTLNGLLDAEADQLCRAKKYERTTLAAILGFGPTSATCRRRRVT